MDTSKYKSLYLQESHEHLSGIEKGLMALEKDLSDPSAPGVIDDLFRHYHSIKGMSASMGYEPVMKLAHAQEELLDRVRSKKLDLSSEITAALFYALDALKNLIHRVEDDIPLDVDITPFLSRLKAAIEGIAGAPAKTAPAISAISDEEARGPELRLSHIMKVEGAVFDDLLTTVGDLFMALSSFKDISQNFRSIELKDEVHTLGKSINTLYNNILSARMLPIEDLTDGLPRIIRDMSKKTGKEIEFKIEGAELSLDRSILESLGAPMVHIIRNAVDHGIEPPEEREKAGKQAKGSITVSAYAKKDSVMIEVSDDGKGIDIGRIKEKARSRGVPEERLRAMTDKEALLLVCMPGLSTATSVTDTSGRGVGMDVVKDVIEGVGGALSVESGVGKGTKIIMALPRTTSIIKALIVTVAEETFLMPISRIEKVIEVDTKNLSGSTFSYDGAEIPVVALEKALGMEPRAERAFYTIVVVEGLGTKAASDEPGAVGRVGIRVHNFGSEIDAFIKPLLPPISKLWGVSGVAIMGDGRPVFLLDVAQIISRAAIS